MTRVSIRFPEALAAVRIVRSTASVASEVPASGAASISDPVREQAEQEQAIAAQREREEAQRAEARAELARTIASSLAGIEALVSQELDQARDWVLELALGLARDVLRNEIDAGRYDLGAAIDASMRDALREGGELRVLVAAEDEQAVRTLLGELGQDSAGDLDRVSVEVSPELERGSVSVSTPSGGFRNDPVSALEAAQARIREAFA